MANLRASKYQWSPIEECDEFDVPVAVHIMPILMNEDYETEQEAIDFVNAAEADPDHCVCDDDGWVIASFFGHDLSSKCSCQPSLREESTIPMYMHRMTQ